MINFTHFYLNISKAKNIRYLQTCTQFIFLWVNEVSPGSSASRAEFFNFTNNCFHTGKKFPRTGIDMTDRHKESIAYIFSWSQFNKVGEFDNLREFDIISRRTTVII